MADFMNHYSLNIKVTSDDIAIIAKVQETV